MGGFDTWAAERKMARRTHLAHPTTENAGLDVTTTVRQCAQCGSAKHVVTTVGLFGAKPMCRPGKGCQEAVATKLPGKQGAKGKPCMWCGHRAERPSAKAKGLFSW